jgi:hypothetical protein
LILQFRIILSFHNIMGVLPELVLPLPASWQGQLAKFSAPVLIAVGAFTFIVVLVVVNILSQLLFKDKNKPPMVFHFFPFLGSTVVYGTDPYAFFAANQKKVRLPLPPLSK